MEEAEEVVRNYSRAGIPLDTIWLDIDYMDGNRDFSLDPVRFAEPKMTVCSKSCLCLVALSRVLMWSHEHTEAE